MTVRIEDHLRRFWDNNRGPLKAATACYLIGLLAGAALAPAATAHPTTLTTENSIWTLLGHNLFVTIGLAAGALSLGAVTLILLLFNGAVLGMAIAVAVEKIPLLTIALALAPHGLLEIPAAVLAGAAGFKTSQLLRAQPCSSTERAPQRCHRDFTILLIAAVVALALAAPLEIYVSARPT